MAPKSIIHKFQIGSSETINSWVVEKLLEIAREHAPLCLVVSLPDSERPFEIYIYASDRAIKGVLV